MELFYTTLGAVLNTTPEKAETLVTQFGKGDMDFFQSYFEELPSAKLEEGDEKNTSVNVTLFVNDNLGSGGYGSVKRNRNKQFAYKIVPDRESSAKRLLYLKSIYKEAIIQTLLQCDPKYGKYICKLFKVYKVGNDCVFQVEIIQTTFEQYFRSFEESYMEDPAPLNATVLKVAVKVLEILNHFRTKYGFNHNDLSLSNIMTAKQGNTAEQLKLIDFGKSSVKFGNIEIGKPLQTRIDTQYFLSKLWGELDLNTTEFSGLIQTLSELPADTPYKTYVDALQEKKGGKRNKKTRRAKRKTLRR
jgi:serine/threonine protein kinase